MMRKKILIKYIAAVMLLTLYITFGIAVSSYLNSDSLYKGVRVEGLALDGHNREQAFEKIEGLINDNFTSKNIKLRYNEAEWILNLKDVSYTFMIEEALIKAFAIGRRGDTGFRLSEIYALKSNPVEIQIRSGVSEERLRTILEAIKPSIDVSGKNASVQYLSGQFKYENETMGIKLDVEKNIDLLMERIIDRDFSDFDLITREVEPDIIYEEIRELNYELSSFSTWYNAGEVNRGLNIITGCRKINNILLMPEDVFSMDSTLGPRTASNGYYPAHVIMQNKLVDGLGGGLCQVASTLYNSVLLADLQIVERMHHTWPLAYVKHGLDATISEGAIDLKFRNDLDYPILIVANASQGKINIRIMGKKPQNENKIRIRSEILETYYPKKEKVIIDNSVPDGQKIVEVQARKGYKIAVYKETLSPASVVLEKERVSLDIYNPITGVVRVNKNYYN